MVQVTANIRGEPARIQSRNGKTEFTPDEAESFKAELKKAGFDRVSIIPTKGKQPGEITAPASKGDIQGSARQQRQARSFRQELEKEVKRRGGTIIKEKEGGLVEGTIFVPKSQVRVRTVGDIKSKKSSGRTDEFGRPLPVLKTRVERVPQPGESFRPSVDTRPAAPQIEVTSPKETIRSTLQIDPLRRSQDFITRSRAPQFEVQVPEETVRSSLIIDPLRLRRDTVTPALLPTTLFGKVSRKAQEAQFTGDFRSSTFGQRTLKRSQAAGFGALSVPTLLVTQPGNFAVGAIESVVFPKRAGEEFGKSLKISPSVSAGTFAGSLALGGAVSKGIGTLQNVRPIDFKLGQRATIKTRQFQSSKDISAQLDPVEFSAQIGSKEFIGTGFGQATRKGKVTVGVVGIQLESRTGIIATSKTAFKQRALTQVLGEARVGVSKTLIKARGEEFTSKSVSVGRIVPVKGRPSQTFIFGAGDFFKKSVRGSRQFARAGVVQEIGRININTLQKTSTITEFRLLEKAVTAQELSKGFPKIFKSKKGQLLKDPILRTPKPRPGIKRSGTEAALLGSQFLKAAKATVRQAAKKDFPLIISPIKRPNVKIRSENRVSNIRRGITSTIKKQDFKITPNAKVDIFKKEDTTRKVFTLPSIITSTRSDTRSFTKSRSRTTPSITGITTIGFPVPPTIRRPNRFPRTDNFKFLRNNRKTGKIKFGSTFRKFKGTQSLSVSLGGTGVKLTKKQKEGRQFISPFAAREL